MPRSTAIEAKSARKALSSKTNCSSPAMSMPSALASQPIRPEEGGACGFWPFEKFEGRHGNAFDSVDLRGGGDEFLVEHDVPAIARVGGA